MSLKYWILIPHTPVAPGDYQKSSVYSNSKIKINFFFNLPNTVAPVKPGALSVAVHDELIVCEWAAVVWVRGGGVVVRLRGVERRERLHGLAFGEAAARRVCVAEMDTWWGHAGQLECFYFYFMTFLIKLWSFIMFDKITVTILSWAYIFIVGKWITIARMICLCVLLQYGTAFLT